jgi:uncharacterized membrane protein YcaP (DUF421 family)
MRKEDIYLYDLHRILNGEAPWQFYIEIAIRAFVVYVVIVFAMRIMGKRLSATLNRNEVAALASLAAAMGLPLLSPDKGLIPAIVVAATVVLIQRLVSRLSFKNKRIEKLTQGDIDILVSNGVMQIPAMTQTRITRERVLAQLRSEGIQHLGQIKRLYLEAGGSFSIIKNRNPAPGLTVLPKEDVEFASEQQKDPSVQVCMVCGNQKTGNANDNCSNCGNVEWVPAVK